MIKSLIFTLILLTSIISHAESIPRSLQGQFMVFPSGNVININTQRFIYINKQSAELDRAIRLSQWGQEVSLTVELTREQYDKLNRQSPEHKQCRRILEHPQIYQFEKKKADYWVLTANQRVCKSFKLGLTDGNDVCEAKQCTQWFSPSWAQPTNPESKLYLFSSSTKAIAFARKMK